MKKERGFALVELILVMLIMTILALTAIPAFNSTSIDSAAHRVLSDLRMAQQMSVTTTTTHGFKNNSNKQFQVYIQNPGNYAEDPSTHSNYLIDLETQYKGVSFAGNYTVEFDAWGRPSTGGGTNIVLTDGNTTKTIVVTTNTGAIYLQ